MSGTKVRKLITGAAMLGVTAAAMVLPAQAAQAWPTGCSSYTNLAHSTAYSECTGGTGTHQVVATCTNGDVIHGPWVRVGQESAVSCDAFGRPPNGWFVRHHHFDGKP